MYKRQLQEATDRFFGGLASCGHELRMEGQPVTVLSLIHICYSVKAGQAIIELRDVKLKRGSRVTLDVSSFRIHPGENVSVIGANGAGKSTLLQVIACLLNPGEGSVYAGGRVVGKEIKALDARRRMAMVLQRPYLLDATVFDNVAIGLRTVSYTHLDVYKRQVLHPSISKHFGKQLTSLPFI